MKFLMGFVIAALAFSLPPPDQRAQRQEGERVTLTVAQSGQLGAYVADAQGRALYMFTADRQAKSDSTAQSNCYDACAAAWPPVIVKEGTPSAGSKLQQKLLGTVARKDGQQQVTYGGWPLYYYVKDTGAGEVTGQDVHSFGGEWYLVTPDGKKLEHKH